MVKRVSSTGPRGSSYQASIYQSTGIPLMDQLILQKCNNEVINEAIGVRLAGRAKVWKRVRIDVSTSYEINSNNDSTCDDSDSEFTRSLVVIPPRLSCWPCSSLGSMMTSSGPNPTSQQQEGPTAQ